MVRLKTRALMLIGGLLLLAVSLTGCNTAATSNASAIHPDVERRLLALEADMKVQKEVINPGTAANMEIMGARMAKAWYAAQAGNWGMAEHQVVEISAAGIDIINVTRPKRIQALQGFQAAYLKPLEEATREKDLAKFEELYKETINGCNACHVSEKVEFVKIKMPTGDQVVNYEWNVQQ